MTEGELLLAYALNELYNRSKGLDHDQNAVITAITILSHIKDRNA